MPDCLPACLPACRHKKKRKRKEKRLTNKTRPNACAQKKVVVAEFLLVLSSFQSLSQVAFIATHLFHSSRSEPNQALVF
jgi:hypothetical protein